MSGARWSPSESRRIVRRFVVEGTLLLQEPAHLGNGDAADLTDMPLLLDETTGRPLLSGSTLAGALRAYLLKRIGEDPGGVVERLFGGKRTKDDGAESLLVIADALGAGAPRVEIRESVKLNPKTRTAEAGALYDLEAWAAGTCFHLRFELAIPAGEDHEAPLRQALATALTALEQGEFAFGSRKRRGFGLATVSGWRVRRYDLETPVDLLAWIRHGRDPLPPEAQVDLLQALEVSELLPDARRRLRIQGRFALDGSLLIRSGMGQAGTGPDVVHLHAYGPDGKRVPVVSGSSLAGALRARAGRILRTIGATSQKSDDLVDQLFGPDLHRSNPAPARASRVVVRQAEIRDGRTDLVQHRVSIDRFTGGSFPTALFNEQPVFGSGEANLPISIEVEAPGDHETGLMLLVLKDLWTGYLPLGGEQSVGRGRLKGQEAEIEVSGDRPATWRLSEQDGRLQTSGADPQVLQQYVEALHAWVKQA